MKLWSAVRERLMSNLILRSEEHTSELQSRSDLVCRLLLEKKKIISKLMDVNIHKKISAHNTLPTKIQNIITGLDAAISPLLESKTTALTLSIHVTSVHVRL